MKETETITKAWMLKKKRMGDAYNRSLEVQDTCWLAQHTI